MRIDKKTLTKGTLILLSSITIIPNIVLASEATVIDDTHHYNNYYFFTGRYDDCLTDTTENKNSEYEFLKNREDKPDDNFTSFSSLNFGYSDPTGTKIKLSLNPKQKKSSDEWTYEGFYRKILEVEKSKGTQYTIDGTECKIKHIEETIKKNTTTTYFAHGCYTNTKNGKVTSSNNLTDPLPPKYKSDKLAARALACSSVDIPYEISNLSIENDRVNVNITRIIGDELKSSTYKKMPAEMSNTAQCKETYLMPLTVEGSCNPTYNNNPYALYAPALYKLSYKVNKHTCKKKNMDTASMECNNTLSIEETCPNQTMINEGFNIKQDISITQNHYASNILTPTTIHQGGGVKFAVEYYSEIKWSPSDRNNVSGAIGDLNSQEVINRINKELYKDNNIKATIKVFQIDKNNNKKKVTEIDAKTQCTKCTIEDWSKDNGVNSLKRECTFSMPNYELSQYDGKVTLSNDEPSSNGVNNRYYTDLNFDGKYEFEFKISNISMLKKEYDWLKKNSDTITVKSDNEDASCQVETVPVNDFVYRPIDLDKPFPNRTPGLNWLEWYSNSTNKERLKEAYDKNNLQYLAVLNNQNVMAIKGYNKNNKYLDWSDIDSDGNSTFITKNKNIVTRQSSTEEGGS